MWSQTINTLAPGEFMAFDSSGGRVGTEIGRGCLTIDSSQPVLPVNGIVRTTQFDPATGNSALADLRMTFWPVSIPTPFAWVTAWEDLVPLGGSSFGGTFTSGFVQNLSATVAHVTITFYQGACGSANVWYQSTGVVGAGGSAAFDSGLGRVATEIGRGCLLITSDQGVVPVDARIRSDARNPQTGDEMLADYAPAFSSVSWDLVP